MQFAMQSTESTIREAYNVEHGPKQVMLWVCTTQPRRKPKAPYCMATTAAWA